ncbi:hypothetical protein [Neptuniibacter halophilus]|uniref:hypothetical protein n=1 Tax=Neptuniibacter halophilus TaxID=651666 RepID=UPI002573357D|nr:hypothetical protein [Neptuniibacter halophilus]
MIELLAEVDKPGTIECSCILKGKEVAATSFPAELRNHEIIAKQAFSYVFLNVAKLKAKHNEAHLEIGEKRLSGFVLKPGVVLICLSAKDANVMLVRGHVHELLKEFRKQEVDQMLA